MALKINFWTLITILVLVLGLMIVFMATTTYMNFDLLNGFYSANPIEVAGEVCGSLCGAGG